MSQASSLTTYTDALSPPPCTTQNRAQRLLADFELRGRVWPLRRRLESLEELALLGDPRFERDPWLHLPAVRARLGGAAHAHESAPAQEVTLPAFDICWRPITVSDFAPFLQDGYDQEQWWTDAPKAIRDRRPWSAPRGWFRQSGGPTTPVVGISWWEARAWCRWASSQARESWYLTGQQQISLPTEPLWERAARGADGEDYPWGAAPPAGLEPRPERFANCQHLEGGPGRPTPVGAFPRGDRTGIADLVGNVYEWCSDPWTPGGKLDWSKPSHSEHDPLASRAVRGGSWAGMGGHLLAASRMHWRPGVRSSLLGFRVMRSTP